MQALVSLFIILCASTVLAEPQQPAETQQTAVPPQVLVKPNTDDDFNALEENSAAVQADLLEMGDHAAQVIETTVSIGRMIRKMRTIDNQLKLKKISDGNLLVDPQNQSLQRLKLKFEDFKDEHWSRYIIPNFEYRFFRRDRDLATVTNPVTLKKILHGIHKTRAQFMPTGCFDRTAESVVDAPICHKRIQVCGSAGLESRERELVAFQINTQLQLEPQILQTPEDAERVLGSRFDTTSDRAMLMSDEVFYFCKIAAKFGAEFQAQPSFYPSEVATATDL